MKCSECGKESSSIITFINLSSNRADYLCDDCLISRSTGIQNIDEIDKLLDETESILRKMTDITQKMKELDAAQPDDDLSAFFMTPAKALKMARGQYDSLLREKQQILDSMPAVDRLTYELKKAIESEDFEKAAELRDQIADAKSKEA